MSSVKEQVLSGIFFTAIAKYTNLIISLGVTAVLARLLVPEQFGIVAVAMVSITFLNLISDIGLFPAIIQYKDLEKRDLSILFSCSCYIGLALSLLLFFSASFISIHYDQAQLRPVLQLLSINLFFTAIAVVPNALFYRERMFKFIAVRSFAIQVLGGTLAVIFAYSGAGIYALLINPILSSILMFLVSYLRFPLHFYFRFSIRPLRHILRYSTFQFLFNIINYFSRNADTLLIGRSLGMISLGYYDKAYQLMSLPLQNITQVIAPVIHPVLSMHTGNQDKILSAHEQMVRLLALIGFPLSVFCFFSAEPLVLILFGPQWIQAIPVFRILSVSIGIQLILSSSGSIFQSIGNTKYLFVCGLFSAILNVSGILLGIFYYKSIVAVATCLVITFSINFLFTYLLMYTILFKTKIWRFLKLLIKPVLYSFVLSIFFYVLSIFKAELIWMQLIMNMIFFIVSFLSFVWFGGYRDLINQFLRRR